jgi:plasmid stabilization system protein ParE
MIRWSRSGQEDLERIHGFLASVDSDAAARAVRKITTAARELAAFPRLGSRLTEFGKREVRRLIIGDYEVRYELRKRELIILRVWHVREDR